MNVFTGIPDHLGYKGTVLTIGIFDGLHLGHQQMLKDLISSSIKREAASLVLTFDPHPEEVLFGKELLFLSSLNERIEAITQLGIDALIVADFNHEIAALEAEDFVRGLLVERLRMKEIWIGHDFRFGKSRQGDFELLERLGRELDFEVKEVKAIKCGEEIVSSTKIRNYLLSGDVQRAALLLGRTYSVKGKVIPGEKRGRIVGYPTANLEWGKGILLPAAGVYAVEITLENRQYAGVVNLGYKPTFNGQGLSLEVHLFDFSQDIYSASLTVSFIQRLREEKRFDSAEALAAQIKADETAAKEILRLNSALSHLI